MKHIQKFENFLGENTVEEMAIGDVRVQAILAAFDTAEKIEKEKIAEIVTGNKKSDRKKLIDELAEIGYNDIKELVDELEINVLEGELYDVKKKVKAGKMHKLLNVPQDKEIVDVYDDPKKLATDLVKATGDKKEATGMLAFAANINPKENIFDKALKAMPEVKESEDVNEGLNQGQARQLSHTILNKMVDLDIMKPKQKTEDLLELITSLIMNSK